MTIPQNKIDTMPERSKPSATRYDEYAYSRLRKRRLTVTCDAQPRCIHERGLPLWVVFEVEALQQLHANVTCTDNMRDMRVAAPVLSHKR